MIILSIVIFKGNSLQFKLKFGYIGYTTRHLHHRIGGFHVMQITELNYHASEI